jgi:restriction system protein
MLLLWPLWLLVACVGALRLCAELWKLSRLRRSGIADIDRMSGETFENWLAVHFRRLGYSAEVIGSVRGDFGGDLLLKKSGTRTVVQAKCWAKNVGIKAVQEVVGARAYYEADTAIVVSNRSFTKQAQELARKTDVALWNREKLVKQLLQLGGVEATPAAPEPSRIGSDICARCGETVSIKVREYCLARHERFGGLVYCFDHQRLLGRQASG